MVSVLMAMILAVREPLGRALAEQDPNPLAVDDPEAYQRAPASDNSLASGAWTVRGTTTTGLTIHRRRRRRTACLRQRDRTGSVVVVNGVVRARPQTSVSLGSPFAPRSTWQPVLDAYLALANVHTVLQARVGVPIPARDARPLVFGRLHSDVSGGI